MMQPKSYISRSFGRFVLHNLLGLVVVTISLVAPLGEQPALVSTVAAQEPTLQTTLETGLKCRKDAEFEFVGLVVEKVQAGELPRDLMIGTMRWAQKKKPEFPFPYFQFAVQKQAKALGVSL